jgi:HK97 family phage prohead protease
MELIRKDLDFDIRQVGAPSDRTLEFIGSTADVDRYGDVIEVDGWDLKNYQKNPVFLWAHDYKQPPIGKAVKVGKTDKGLLFQIKFAGPDEYAFADTVYKLYLGGYLRATSVGFQDLEREPISDKEGKQTGWRYKRQELYELSAVPVPANPQALIMAVQKGVVNPREVEEVMGVPYEADLIQEAEMEAQEEQVKGVIPFKEYPTDPEDAPWDGPAEIKAAEVADLKVICTWFDSENPDIKNSYKLPHHRAKGYKVVWRGVAAAMAALLGSRGGVNIPEADRQGVYNHLAKHYAQFEKEPPEFKEYSDKDLAMIEMGLPPVMDKLNSQKGAISDIDLISLLMQLLAALYDWLMGDETPPAPASKATDFLRERVLEIFSQASAKALHDFFKAGDGPVIKAGAVLSAKNKAALKQAQALIQEVLDSAEPTGSEENGAATQNKDIYSLALNPGVKPQGGRPAGGTDLNQILSKTLKIQQRIRGGK